MFLACVGVVLLPMAGASGGHVEFPKFLTEGLTIAIVVFVAHEGMHACKSSISGRK